MNNHAQSSAKANAGSSATPGAVPRLPGESSGPEDRSVSLQESGAAGKGTAISAHPLLFGCLVVLVGYRQLRPYFDLKEFLWNLLAVLACITLVQLLFGVVARKPYKSAIAASLCVVSFCFFGDFKALCERWLLNTSWSALASARWVLPVTALVFVLLFWTLVRCQRSLFTLHRYLNVLSGALVLANAAEIAWSSPRIQTAGNPRAQSPLHLGANPPDIYYILADGYTSPESLMRFWRYDDSPLVNSLTQQGFQVVTNAHGNSTFTPWCLSIYLNMDYPPTAVSSLPMPAQTVYYGRIIEDAEAPARLKASGYEIANLSIFATAGQPRYYFFPKISVSSLGGVLLNRTPIGYLLAYRTRAFLGDTNLDILSRLPAIAAQRSGRPKFVYAHLMMPHPPYLFDSEGHRIQRGMGMDDQYPDLYLGQLIYENKLLTNVIAGILKNSKTPPVIILQGDHGFRSLPGEHQQEEATTILNALYLPGSTAGWIYPGMTPVNTFRMIFNHYFGEHYDYLPDNVPKALSRFVKTSP